MGDNAAMRNIYIWGGEALALNYRFKLEQAKNQGLIDYERLFLVTSHQNSPAAKQFPDDLIPLTPSHFVLSYLEKEAENAEKDIIIPDHTAPHILLQVFLEIAQKKFPEHTVELSPLVPLPETPFKMDFEKGAIRAISHATWTCPLDCEEPPICPHTEKKRTWDFLTELNHFKTAQENLGIFCFTFFCPQFVNAVAKLSCTTVVQELQKYIHLLQKKQPCKIIVATHSHCHGIVGQLRFT